MSDIVLGMPNLITLTGPSGCGKSEAVEYITKISQYSSLAKYSTRISRNGKDDGIINVKKLPDFCDYRYKLYDKEYGFSSAQLYFLFKNNLKPIIIINDRPTLVQLRKTFGDSMISYFMHRERPNIFSLTEICKQRGIADQSIIEKRLEVATNIYNMYTDYISLFDGIILNTGNKDQLYSLLQNIFGNNNHLQQRKPRTEGCKIFVISGNAASGKDIIAQRARELGCEVVRKHTDRMRNKDDKDEIICSNDGAAFDLKGCDITYKSYDNTYGIKTREIWKNLIRYGKNQVLVCSDVAVIRRLREIFGNAVIPLYIHSDVTREEYANKENELKNDENYIKRRTQEFEKAHKDYVDNFYLYSGVMIYYNEKELLRQFTGILGIPVELEPAFKTF